jgi:hypothetical protein
VSQRAEDLEGSLPECVATKYLDSYLGWRCMIDRDGEHATPGALSHGRRRMGC